ncbi:MAG TPA: peptide-binding protein [Syntrophobacteraceae bacterium]|nr:peptide-binding protein [Syntrophobacteraceae bacterium]
MRRRVSVLALSIISALLILQAPDPARAQIPEIRIGDSKGDWGYPNPYRHYPRGPGYIRMSWVFDTLVWKDREGYVPALAESWSYDPAKTAFAFNLNPRAKWHDLKPVTADDVAFTIEYFKKHPYSWISVEDIGRVEAQGPHKVVIYLSKPYSPFISDIGGTMPVLPRHIWQSVTNPEAYDDPKAFIGSGPYRFVDFNKTQGTYLCEAFGEYYQGKPRADRLIYVRTGQPLVSLAGRQVDLANIQPDMAEPLKQKGLVVIKDERGWNKKLMINHRKAPFSDRRFRHALAFAVNQQEIIDKSHRGFAMPASYGLLSPDHDMYNPNTPSYSYSPEKAHALIESLGYQRGTDGYYQKGGQPLKIELLSSNITVAGQSVVDRDGEVIKKQLEQVGIRADLVNLEQTTTDSKVKSWNFDLAVSGHGGVSGDPRILNEMISSKYGAGSVNSARYDEDQELNALLEEQMVEMNEENRKTIVYKIQEVYAQALPAISLYYPDSMSAYTPEKGIVWYYTRGGISKGIPIPQNKMSLINKVTSNK